MPYLSFLSLSIMSFLLATNLPAQITSSNTFNLEPLVISSSRLDDISPHFVQKQIVGSITTDLEEELNSLSGVYFSQIGGMGGSSEVLIRGAEPNFTKTYIEGIEVNDPTDSRGEGFQLNQLGWNLYGTIDLIKGSHSAVQGSGSMSGLLSIRFPDASIREGSILFNGTIGSFGYYQYGLGFNGKYESTGIRLQTSRTVEDDRFEGSEFENTSGFLKLTQRIAGNSLLNVSAWSGKTKRTHFPDDSGGPLYAAITQIDSLESEDYGLSLQYRQGFKQQAEWVLVGGYYHNDSLSDSPGVAPGLRNPFGVPANVFSNIFERWQLDSYLRGSLCDQFDAVIGFSSKQENGGSESSIILPFAVIPGNYEQSRTFLSVFTEGNWKVTRNQHILMAQRMDKADGFDLEWSPSIKYIKQSDDASSIFHIAYNHGFKVPSLFALNHSMVGNPDLKPESVDTFETGFSKFLLNQKLRMGIRGFLQDYKNLVDMSEVTQTLVNLSSVSIVGVELELEWKINDAIQLTFQGTHLDLDLEDEGEILRYRPEWTFGVGVSGTLGESNRFFANYSYVHERWDSSIPTGNVLLEAYSRLNIRMEHQFTEQVTIALGGYNLLNQKDETAIGYIDPGSSFRISINVSL